VRAAEAAVLAEERRRAALVARYQYRYGPASMLLKKAGLKGQLRRGSWPRST